MINFMLLDTETTDLKGHCLQLAFRHYEEDRLIREFNEMFMPPTEINPKAQEVHGITLEMLKDKPFIGVYQPELQPLFDKTIVVAHNAEFDVSILVRDGFKIPFSICTVKVAKHFWPRLPKHQLQFLRQEFQLEISDETKSAKAHDAWGDILILEQLFFRILEEATERWPQKSPKEIFAELINISRHPRW